MINSWVAGFKKPSKETRYGDSQVFIDTKNGICFIVDGGDGECASKLVSYLKENKINKVYLLLTHPHSDHGDGLRKIIKDSYFTVLCFYCYDPNSLKGGLRNNRGSNSVREDIDYLNKIISEAKSRNIEVKYLAHGDKVELGDIKFNVYREQPSRVEDDDTYGWAYVNDGSLCLYFPELYYWTSGDGSDRIWDFIKKLGLTVSFFKIPHHGNNCTQSQANGLKSHGANLCWYNDLEPNGVGTTDFTAYGARRCKEAGITVIDCIGSDIYMSFAMGKARINKGSSNWTYAIPYMGEYTETWIKNVKGWWYRYKDGSWAIGWKTINEKQYYFDKDGYMVTGWQYLQWDKGYSWFFFDKTSGVMKTGWVYDNNYWYYLNPTDGHMQTGWLDYNGRKCYLEPVGGRNQGHAYRSVTVMIDGETWQFNDSCYGTKVETSVFQKRTVIDISQFNNVTNWSAVKATGYPVIIRIGYRGSKTGVITYDPRYKEYRSACEQYGIEHGFYFFPCSITDSEAHEEALFIKNEVIKSGMAMPVFLDSEVVQRDKSGRSDNLSKEKRTKMLKIICDDLLKWDIPVGIYASRSWLYNNLDMGQFATEANDNTWVAEYGVDATKYTGVYVMWQYTSKGSVNGISGNVDMSYQYRPFHLVKTSVNQVIETSAPVKIEKSELEKVIEVAKSDLGYLEKALKYKNNKEILYDKTKGASDENTTKHWFEIKQEWQGQPWCAIWICWVFTRALGEKRAKELLKHYPYTYCPTMSGLFTLHANPKVGDIVIFKRNGTFVHTGLVIAVDGDKFTTIEGNTSGASNIVANGGGVCQKTYYNSKLIGTKFCRPAYSSTAITSDVNKVVVADDMHTVKWKGYVNVGKNTKLAVRLQPNTSAKECSFSGLKQGTEVGVSYEQGDWYLIKYDGKFGYVQSQYISKTKISEVSNPDPVVDDIHTVKWTGIVNTNGGTLNVRLQPTTSAKTCSFSPLRKGTEIGVCHQNGDWYLIKYNGKYGYVYSSYVKRK